MQGGIFLSTQTKNMRLRTEKRLTLPEEQPKKSRAVTVPTTGWGQRILRADRLLRDLAVVGALFLTVLAVRNAQTPESQSVFSALQESANMQWDETLGQLSFVSNWLPESVQAVWNGTDSLTVLAPITGQTVHAWSKKEPYVEWMSEISDVRCVADGEVMSIAHGLGEERILRIRHDDDTESIYGNLAECFAAEGDRVTAGQIIARVLEDQPLAFELRRDGRSIDPKGRLLPLEE